MVETLTTNIFPTNEGTLPSSNYENIIHEVTIDIAQPRMIHSYSKIFWKKNGNNINVYSEALEEFKTLPEDREIGNQLNLEQHGQENFFDFFQRECNQCQNERERRYSHREVRMLLIERLKAKCYSERWLKKIT